MIYDPCCDPFCPDPVDGSSLSSKQLVVQAAYVYVDFHSCLIHIYIYIYI